MKVYIDIGHGGSDPGAVSTIQEKVLNLPVGLHLKKQLQYIGFIVKCSRESDVFVSLEDRVKDANDWGADIFISIHHNAGKGDGAEVYHSVFGGNGKIIANLIGEEFKVIGQNVRFVTSRQSDYGFYDYYYVIRYTNMPAIISEYVFIDTPADLAQVDELHEQKAEANAIAKAICKFAGVEFLDSEYVPAINYEDKYNELEIKYNSLVNKLKALVSEV